MSYILDALRRADAERERGAVPSLHTQQYGALPGDEDEAPRRARGATIAALLLAVALVAVVGWHYLGDTPPARPVVQAIAPPAPPTAVVAAVPNDAASSPATEPPSPASAQRAPTLAVPPAVRPPTAHTPAKATAAAPRAASATPLPAKPAASASASDRVYAVADLPDDVRRELPKLAFGGASYSSAASSRMVIYNGQVFHEGDSIATGVVLQRINRKSAILALRSYRVELAF